MSDIIPPKNFKPKYRKPKQPNFFARLFRRDKKSKLDQELQQKLKKAQKQNVVVGTETGLDLFLQEKAKTTGKIMEFKKEPAFVPEEKKKVSSKSRPAKTRPMAWGLIILAFLFALFLVLIYFERDKLPFAAYYFSRIKGKIQKTLSYPSEISFTPEKPAASALAYYARQNKDKIEVVTVDSGGQSKVFFSFIGSNLDIDSVAISANYIAYIDNFGLKLYSFQTKQTDLVLAGTQVAQIIRVYISPEEHYLAFFVMQDKQLKLYTYSIASAGIRDRSFIAQNMAFGSNNLLYFSDAGSFFYYNYEKNEDEVKITDFAVPILTFYKTAKNIFFVSGQKSQISLWQINESPKTAAKVTDINLTFDFTFADFGLAQDGNNLYLSLAGQTLLVDLKTKEKKDFSFNLDLYKLLNFDKDAGYFFAYKKPNGLNEYSLIIFKPDTNKPLFESSIESEIIYLK